MVDTATITSAAEKEEVSLLKIIVICKRQSISLAPTKVKDSTEY
jgi:hypothetical protein